MPRLVPAGERRCIMFTFFFLQDQPKFVYSRSISAAVYLAHVNLTACSVQIFGTQPHAASVPTETLRCGSHPRRALGHLHK